MKPQTMSLERFSQLLAAYGSELELWPDSERGAAQALLDASEPARAMLKAESPLDGLFSRISAHELSSDLERRLNEIPVRHAVRRRWPFGVLWPALGWSFAAACGIALGVMSSSEDSLPTATVTTEEDEVLALAAGAFGAVSEDFEELP